MRCNKGEQNGKCETLSSGTETDDDGIRNTAFDRFLREEAVDPMGKAGVYTRRALTKVIFDDTDATKE